MHGKRFLRHAALGERGALPGVTATRFNRMLFTVAAMVATAAVAAAAFSLPAAAQDRTITMFAAASLTNAIDAIDAAFTAKTDIKVVASYAASSDLMKQIERGAPADVFASADLDWMDYGSRKKLVRDDTRVNLLGNTLVLIAPKDFHIRNVAIGPGFDLAGLAGEHRIATGDARSVPVGKYARASLERLGSWTAAEPKFVFADNVRAALFLVAHGEAALGIVYATDARVEPNVKVIGIFPPETYPAIVYPVALTSMARPEAAQYLAFLQSQQAKMIFEGHGFAYLVRPPS